MAHTVIVQGTSEPYDFQLRNNGAPLNGDGLTVTLELYKGKVAATPPLPSVAWLDPPNGTVRVTGMQTLTLGTYRVRYRLTDAGSLIGYAPNGNEPDIWTVVPPSA